jgi:putative transposase
MARIARLVVPGLPHHVTQRGNRRQRTFFHDGDFMAYLGLMCEWCAKCGVEIWAYCLMSNHVHFIAVPATADALAAAIGEAHRRYTLRINEREGWRGYLWQGRFASFPMDEAHLLSAARYVELNPVRAGMVERPEDYLWSSAQAHLRGRDDILVRAAPLLQRFPEWRAVLHGDLAQSDGERLRRHSSTGRPLGDAAFVARVETVVGRSLTMGKPGRRPIKAFDGIAAVHSLNETIGNVSLV